MSAINKQVGGDHYKKLKYQPLELAYDVQGTPGLCKLAKYMTRDKGSTLENLLKAAHVIRFEQDYYKARGIMKPAQKLVYAKQHAVMVESFAYQFEHGALIEAALNYMRCARYDDAHAVVESLILILGE